MWCAKSQPNRRSIRNYARKYVWMLTPVQGRVGRKIQKQKGNGVYRPGKGRGRGEGGRERGWDGCWVGDGEDQRSRAHMIQVIESEDYGAFFSHRFFS